MVNTSEDILKEKIKEILNEFHKETQVLQNSTPLGIETQRYIAQIKIMELLALQEKQTREETLQEKLDILNNSYIKEPESDMDRGYNAGISGAISNLVVTGNWNHELHLDEASIALTKGKKVFNCSNCPTSYEAENLDKAHEMADIRRCPRNMMFVKDSL